MILASGGLPILLGTVAIPYLVMIGISAALAAASYFLLQPKLSNANKQRDFTPTTLATQGSYVPPLLGHRRLGAVCAWAGGLIIGEGPGVGGHKGSKRKKKSANATPNYIESAWHLICVGPAWRLHAIYADGKIIWPLQADGTFDEDGFLDADVDASGVSTLVGGTNLNEFVIYWGEADQPINTYLGASSRVGVSSRWPHVCYVQWTRKDLGPSHRWPQIEYDVETRCPEQTLCGPAVRLYGDDTADDFYLGPGVLFSGGPFTGSVVLHETAAGGATATKDSGTVPTTGYYRLEVGTPAESHDGQFYFGQDTFPGGKDAGDLVVASMSIRNAGVIQVLMASQAIGRADADPPTGDCCTFYDELDPDNAYPSRDWQVRHGVREHVVFLEAGPIDAWVDGVINAATGASDFEYVVGADLYFRRIENVRTGVSPMAALSQILFGTYPHGLGLDSAAFDVARMDELAGTLHDEGLIASVLAPDGQEAQGVVASLMQDAGLLWFQDYDSGLLEFDLQRYVSAPTAVESKQLGDTVEIEVLHLERAVDKLVFSFPDSARAFRETTIAINDDGQPREVSTIRARVVPISTTVDYRSAARIAERRSQEELGDKARFQVLAGGSAGSLWPGTVISVPGIEPLLRVMSVAIAEDESAAKLDCVADAYGASLTTYERLAEEASVADVRAAEANVYDDWTELPAWLTSDGLPAIVPLHVRANVQTNLQVVHLSADDTTYVEADQDQGVHIGGELTQDLDGANYLLATGPTFSALGVDVDQAQDLSADTLNWGLGRQVMVIGSGSSAEVIFLQKVTNVGGGVYRLDGLMRARYDTDLQAWPSGTKFVVMSGDEFLGVTDPLLRPGATLYVKQQPISTVQPLSLAAISPDSHTLLGKGAVPISTGFIRVVAPVLGAPSYAAGEGLTFAWGYRTARAGVGVGMFGAGEAWADDDIAGEFEVRLFDASDVETASSPFHVSAPSWTLDHTTLIAELGGETDFRIEVRNIEGGLKSPARSLSITAI